MKMFKIMCKRNVSILVNVEDSNFEYLCNSLTQRKEREVKWKIKKKLKNKQGKTLNKSNRSMMNEK